MRLFVAALVASFFFILGASGLHAEPQGFAELAIGAVAPDFDLPGVDGKRYSLKDFAGAKLLAVVFTCNHCPTAQAYEDRIMQLQADYKDKGLAFVAISPNDDAAVRLDELGYTDVGDSFEDMKVRAQQRGFKFPYLYDGETQKTSLAYGVVATPQVFLFDEARKLRYVGRVDDGEVKMPTSHDARNAIEALLAGKPVPVEKTRTFGCSTKWAEKRADAKASLEKWNQEEVKIEKLDEAALKKLMANDSEDVLLVNVWATWCGPCLAELPEFVEMHRMYRKRNFKLVTISLDEKENEGDALKALKEVHASGKNFISTIDNKDTLADVLDKDWKGPLPHTVLIGPKGKILYRHNGPIEPLEVRRAVVDFLGRTYASKK